MKSKTSFFNRTLFKKNVTHFWPLWLVYFGLLLLIEPLNIWRMVSEEWDISYYTETEKMYEIMYATVRTMADPIMIFIFAGAAALVVFSYLYFTKNANMIHALPVNRLELYITNYLSGLSFLIVPAVITFFVAVLVCLANEITCIQYLFLGLICQIGLSFFAYSLAVFVAMFTGQLLAMPVYYLVVNYLYVGCLFIVNSVKEILSYGLTQQWNPGKSCILSPLYYLNNNLRVRGVYEEQTNVTIGIEVKGMELLAIYAIAAVFISILGYRVYRRYRIETSGDWISIGIVKPLFRWGVAFCCGILLSLSFTGVFADNHKLDTYMCMMGSMIVLGFLCFFTAEMLLQKNFKVLKKKRLLEWAGFTAVALFFITLFEVDAFGIERFQPKAEEIETAFVNMDYPIQVKAEDIPKLLELQKYAIEGKNEYQKIEQQGHGYYYTTFRYYLKDGTTYERRYPIPVMEEYVKEEPTATLLNWEKEEDNLKRNILGMNYATNQYTSGYIDLYNDEDEYKNFVLNKNEAAIIAEAIVKDIEAGNYDDYYLYSIHDASDCFYNNISLDYYSENGYYDNWDYFYNYGDYYNEPSGTKERAAQANCYITFGPKCKYTIQALENLGITDDTWKLCENAEYYE